MTSHAPGGWLVAVLMDEPGAVREFFAVGLEDPARAEWAAVDAAMALGAVAPAPRSGHEPVESLAAVNAAAARSLGLLSGEVRLLGRRWPRRWFNVPGSA